MCLLIGIPFHFCSANFEQFREPTFRDCRCRVVIILVGGLQVVYSCDIADRVVLFVSALKVCVCAQGLCLCSSFVFALKFCVPAAFLMRNRLTDGSEAKG